MWALADVVGLFSIKVSPFGKSESQPRFWTRTLERDLLAANHVSLQFQKRFSSTTCAAIAPKLEQRTQDINGGTRTSTLEPDTRKSFTDLLFNIIYIMRSMIVIPK